LAGALDGELVGVEFAEAHGAAGVEAVGADADLGAVAVFETGGGAGGEKRVDDAGVKNFELAPDDGRGDCGSADPGKSTSIRPAASMLEFDGETPVGTKCVSNAPRATNASVED